MGVNSVGCGTMKLKVATLHLSIDWFRIFEKLVSRQVKVKGRTNDDADRDSLQ